MGETPFVSKSCFLTLNRGLAFAPSVLVNITIKMEYGHKLFPDPDVVLNRSDSCSLPSRIVSCAA